MKGEIFTLFEQFLNESFGESCYDEVLADVRYQLSTPDPFVGPSVYPDADFLVLVIAASGKLGLTVADTAHAFGQFCFPHLLRRAESFSIKLSSPRDVLTALHNVIHVEVKKVSAGAEPPEFAYTETGANTATLTYSSKRKLYSFVSGMLDGMAEHYGLPIKHSLRMIEDADVGVCAFDLTFG